MGNTTENIDYNTVFNAHEEVKVNSPKVKIINVENISLPNISTSGSKVATNANSLTLDKQIYNPEALQMSLVCDNELPLAWDDVLNYPNNASEMDIFKENLNENPLTAVPTAIQSYINLPLIPTSVPVDNIKNQVIDTTNLSNDNFIEAEPENSQVNLLKITAEADICSCNNCKCTSHSNGQSCVGTKNLSPSTGSSSTAPNCAAYPPSRCSIPHNISPNVAVQSSCCNSSPKVNNCISNVPVQSPLSATSPTCTPNSPIQSSCCTSTSSNNLPQKRISASDYCVNNSVSKSFTSNSKPATNNRCGGVNSAIQLIRATNPECNKKGDNCCVVICLKTMEQLKQMLSLASGCNSFQNITLGCVPTDFCVPK